MFKTISRNAAVQPEQLIGSAERTSDCSDANFRILQRELEGPAFSTSTWKNGELSLGRVRPIDRRRRR